MAEVDQQFRVIFPHSEVYPQVKIVGKIYGSWHFKIEKIGAHYNGFVALNPYWSIPEELLEKIKIFVYFYKVRPLPRVSTALPNSNSTDNDLLADTVHAIRVPKQLVYIFNLRPFEILANPKFRFEILVQSMFPLCRKEMESLMPTAKAHLMDLFESGKYGNVLIKIKGKKDIRAHDIILSRSKVFDVMLNRHNSKEARDKIIHIKDIEHDVMIELIRFLYYDEIPRMEDMAVKLLIAADKYDVTKLSKECSSYLLKNIDMDNFSDVLVASYKLGIADLKTTAIDFVIENRRQIFDSDGWKNLKETHNLLAWEVVEKFMSNAV